MATVYLIDLTAHYDDGVPPGWRCAAELSRCASVAVAAELWRGRPSAAPLGPYTGAESDFFLAPFPTPITAVNRYFSTDVEAVVGSLAPSFVGDSFVRGEQQMQQRVAAVLQPRLSSNAFAVKKKPYGCVFIVNECQSTDVIPWHLVPPAESLFAAVLVTSAPKCERNGDRGHELAGSNAWQAACARHRFEHIPWYVANGLKSLTPVPADVGRVGLLGGSLTGSARVGQVLCNTLWPSEVRKSEANATGQKQSSLTEPATSLSQLETPPAQGTKKRASNSLLMIGGGSATYMLKLCRSFILPGWRLAEKYGAQGEINAQEAMCGQDVRFFTHLAAPAAGGKDEKEKAVGGEMSCAKNFSPTSLWSLAVGDENQLLLTLVNRYYSADVRASFLHAALFDPTTSDLLHRQFEGIVHENGAHAPHATGGVDAATTAVGVPVLVFWPPNGGFSEDEMLASCSQSRFQYQPLSTILTSLRAQPGIGDILVVTGARVAFAVCNSGAGGEVLTKSAFKSLYNSDRLDAVEAQQCDSVPGVEVLSLIPATGIKMRRSVIEAGASATEGRFVYSRPQQEEEEAEVMEEDTGWGADVVQGPAGGDRLREFLHSQDWPVKKLFTDGATASCRAPPRNICAFYAFGINAEEEEQWIRHVLAHLFLSSALVGESKERKRDAWEPLIEAACAGIPSLHLHDLSVSIVNKYFEAPLSLRMVAGGVAARMWRETRKAASDHHCYPGAVPSDLSSLEAGAAAHIIVCSRQILHNCAEGNDSALANLLLAAQRRLWSKWVADLEGVVADSFDTSARRRSSNRQDEEESLALLHVVDLSPDDMEAATSLESDLNSILFRGQNGHTPPEEEHEAITPFSLIEVVAADAGATSTANETGADALSSLSGCARLAEALSQHPWPEKTERIVQGVPRPLMHTDVADPEVSVKRKAFDSAQKMESGSAGTVKEPAKNAQHAEPEQSAPEEHATPSIGCTLPAHYLVDPLTLRSVAVPALLYYQSQPLPLVREEEKIRGQEIEKRHHDDLLAWIDKMKVFGHKLPHEARRQQASTLALAMEHVL